MESPKSQAAGWKAVPLLAGILLAVLTLAACGGGSTQAASAGTAASEPHAATEAPTATTAPAATTAPTATTAPAATEAPAANAAPAAAIAPATTGEGTYSLEFPVNDFTEKTMTVTTSSGIVEVTYHVYEHIPYVSNPVDTDYQSLDVKVPVRIDGQPVDATNAPILFLINVGGYMSVNNASGGMGVGAPVGGLVNGEAGGPPNGEMPAGGPPSGNMPAGGPPSGDRPAGGPPNGPMPGGMMGGPGGNSGVGSSSDLALAAGYVVVTPGVRGRDNQADDGTYFGKAPAAIVDLKAAVRYLHFNDAAMPGNAEQIVTRGTSAGGALSSLVGVSGDSAAYDSYLDALGAADASDSVFASAAFCPITDLDHADMAYEWMLGTVTRNGEQVDQTLSQALAAAYPAWLESLHLSGGNDFGAITADNFKEYLLKTLLVPSANEYLKGLSDDERSTYLAANPWITWAGDTASFSFDDFVSHIGRSKGVPAFDALDLSAAENSLFGDETTNARHFTDFSLQQTSGDANAAIDDELQTVVNLMNPMYFLSNGGSTIAQHWWIRQGSSDTDTGLPVLANLSTALANQGKDVNTRLYWDAGHGADEDPEAMIAWIAAITGYGQ